MSVSFTYVTNWMTRYVMSTYLALGISGNLINIYMFTRKDRLNNSCSLHLLALSISHIITAGWGIIPILYGLDNVDPSTYSFVYCKLRLYTFHSSIMIGRTLLVAACIDRYAVSANSQRLRVLNSPKVALGIIFGITLAWPCINIYMPVLTTFTGNSCITPASNTIGWGIYTVVVPGVLIPGSMIIFGLMTIRNRRRLRGRIAGNRNRSKKRDSTLTVMLLNEVLVYLLSTSLFPANTLYKAVTLNYIKSAQRQAIENLISYLGNTFLLYVNSSATFYVYIMASRTYRRECKRVLLRLWMHLTGKKNRVSSIPTIETAVNQFEETQL